MDLARWVALTFTVRCNWYIALAVSSAGSLQGQRGHCWDTNLNFALCLRKRAAVDRCVTFEQDSGADK